LIVTSTLAYYNMGLITAVKSFIVNAPGVKVVKRFILRH
jgi:hypothetical protein